MQKKVLRVRLLTTARLRRRLGRGAVSPCPATVGIRLRTLCRVGSPTRLMRRGNVHLPTRRHRLDSVLYSLLASERECIDAWTPVGRSANRSVASTGEPLRRRGGANGCHLPPTRRRRVRKEDIGRPNYVAVGQPVPLGLASPEYSDSRRLSAVRVRDRGQDVPRHGSSG